MSGGPAPTMKLAVGKSLQVGRWHWATILAVSISMESVTADVSTK